jgi:hypothetical protein
VSAVKAAIWLLDANGTTSSLADSTEKKHNVAARSSSAGEPRRCMLQRSCMLRPAGELVCKQGEQAKVCMHRMPGWLERIGS